MNKKLVSVVIPCLNEEQTIKTSIKWAKVGLSKLPKNYTAEIIIVDNGSIDQSVKLAKKEGVKVLHQPLKGYGMAYIKGLNKSSGKYILIGDSDATYDFRLLPFFIKKLEQGNDLVLGSRLKDNVKPRQMSFTHKYIGNPFLTSMLNLFYGSNITDAHTGMRAFTKNTYRKLNMKGKGMEFASEMIIKAIYHQLKIAEIPIPYYKRLGKSKLLPLPDAYRHIKYILLYSPTYVFVIPGIILFLIGSIISIALLPGGLILFGRFFDIHTMSVAILCANLGVELILLGVFSRLYTIYTLGLPSGPLGSFLINNLSVDRLLFLGSILCLAGLTILGFITINWIESGFGSLSKIREFIFTIGLCVIGTEIIFSSFLFGLLKNDSK